MSSHNTLLRELRALAQNSNPAPWTSRLASAAADKIEQLSKELATLHCLDVTAREGQQAFNKWRNRSVQNG